MAGMTSLVGHRTSFAMGALLQREKPGLPQRETFKLAVARASASRAPGRDVMVVGKHRRGKTARWLKQRLHVTGALLLAVSGCIHLDLYLTGYRSIPTIGRLFLVEVIVA